MESQHFALSLGDDIKRSSKGRVNVDQPGSLKRNIRSLWVLHKYNDEICFSRLVPELI